MALSIHRLLKNKFVKKLPNSDKNQVGYWIKKLGNSRDWTVLQIGANDGKTKDPLHGAILENKKWKVVFVEPVPYIFQKLKENYPREERFIFENAAINDGLETDFYWVDEKAKYIIGNLPEWYDQLGSFDKNNIIKHLNGRLAPYIVSKKIQGITLNNLIEKHGIGKIDLLRIDCEGHDWKILSQLAFDRFTPFLILFEFKHLSKTELRSSIEFLSEKYALYPFEGDLLCLLKSEFGLAEKDLKYLDAFHSIPIELLN